MVSQRERMAADLVAAAFDFYRRRLWDQVGPEDAIALRIPTESAPCIATVIGHNGEMHGLILFRGPRPLADVQAFHEENGHDEEGLVHSASELIFSMSRLSEIPPHARKVLEEAKYSGRRESIAPLIVSKPEGRQPRNPNATEVRTLLFALRGILGAADQGLLRPRSVVGTDELLTLTLSGAPRAPEVKAKFETFADAGGPRPGEAPVPLDLGGLQRIRARWAVGEPVLPIRLEDDDERLVRGFLVVDEGSGRILRMDPKAAPSVAELAGELGRTFRGNNTGDVKGLPEAIACSSRRLFEALAPAFAAAGVAWTFEPDHPGIKEIAEAFVEDLPDELAEGPAAPPEDELPAGDDLQAWKDADQSLIERFAARIDRRSAEGRRALAAYFGDAEKGADYFDRYRNVSANVAFAEWYLTHWRASPRSRTLAEVLLAGPLPLAERRILEARRATAPSLHRVDAMDQGEWVDFIDVVTGQRRRVHDRRLSECVTPDLCLFARIHPAGEFRFIVPAGPPLPPLALDDALRFLEDVGLRMTPGDLERKPHLLGRLWEFHDERSRDPAPLRLQNTDSEELRWHVASFRVRDVAALREGLRARPDIDEEEDGRWVWLRRERNPKILGDVTLLGRLQLLGDELVAEVNSEPRFRRIREWLSAVPGVEFLRVSTREFAAGGATPLDDRLAPPAPSALPPEVERAFRERFREFSMRWLDEKIPALCGKTPREACRTEAGRRRVAQMIRSMPRPTTGTGPPVDVPREEMLRELGIGNETENEAEGA